VDIPKRAGTGVWLGTAPLLIQWRDRIETSAKTGVPSPIEWFLHLEALSDASPDVFDRKPVPISTLAAAVGVTRDVVDEGVIFSSYDILWKALDLGVEPGYRGVPARTRLYQQARMATFLRYRDGFVASLAAIPFTAEAAIHGYLRVVLDWARNWPGLALSDVREREAAVADVPAQLRRGRHRDRFLRVTRFSPPLIVQQDLAELFRLARRETSEVSSTGSLPTEALAEEELAMAVMDNQIRFSLSHVVEDPTLTSLSAANLIRAHANEALGGALLRLRLRPADELLVQTRLLEEIRRSLVQPRVDAVAQGQVSRSLAELEQRLSSLGVMRRLLSDGSIDG
jgi:hypothetical protein